MNAAVLERDLFAPQQPPGMRSGLALAILAHVLLIVALAWSVRWKSSEPEGIVAELWSATPQAAAPRVTAPEPQPTPVTEAKPPPKPEPPPPKPAPAVKPEPAPPPRADAQIAIERAKVERARREEAERDEAARQAELRKREEMKREDAKRAEAKRLEAERQRAAEQAERKQQAEQTKKEETRQAAIRDANLRRMMKEAGSSDDPGATGNAARSSGPSAGYAGRIKARVKPNIVLTAAIDGNPSATVEVRVAPDGTIVGKKLVKSSGSPVWDETVLRAIDKTEVLPKDVDGRVPPTISMEFRPRD